MTNKQKMDIVYQMLAQLKALPEGKKTSTAKLLGQVELADEDFLFDADDLAALHNALMQRAHKEHLRLELVSGGFGMDYVAEFVVKRL